MSNLENNKSLITDLIEGDKGILLRKDFNELKQDDINTISNLIINNPKLTENKKIDLQNNLWKVNYKQKPPTIEEFLTEEWIGAMNSEVYPHVKDTLINFFSLKNNYRYLYLVACIGWGKSVTSAIVMLYILTLLSIMHTPKKFYNVAVSSTIIGMLASFTMKQVKRVLLKPFYNILKGSGKYIRVKKSEDVEKYQKEIDSQGLNNIVWTTASNIESSLNLSNDIHLMIGSSPEDYLGLSIICGAISEISFFLKKGVSPEEINQFHNDLKVRIDSRFGKRYLARAIVDSSPNSFDSPIDKYVFGGEAEKDNNNYIIRSAHWELDYFVNVKKDIYPIWKKTKETFPVFKGTGGKPAKILDNSEIDKYNINDIYNVPIDLYRKFEADVVKCVKDYCGYPSGSYDKLIPYPEDIENIFYDTLKNIYTSIVATANEMPEKLIWNEIKDIFFVNINNHYQFYRSIKEGRYIHIDQSEATDATAIAMVHPEINIDGEIVIVTDFTIVIEPTKDRINLEAILYFIKDLKKLGNINIKKITFDRYQSSNEIQNLKREDFNVDTFSVDNDKQVYYYYISLLKNRRLKVGRNLFLKNNLKSLQEVELKSGKKKIDHTAGKIVFHDNEDWKLSQIGINAKDCSDAHCGAVYNCIKEVEINKYIPKYQWEELKNINNENYKEKLYQKEKITAENYLLNKLGLVIRG